MVVRLEACKDRLQRVALTVCTKRMVQKTKTDKVRAYPCQVDEVAGRAPRIDCYGSLGAPVPSYHNSLSGGGRPATLSTWHERARTSAVFVFCTIRLVQNVRATLCRRSLHTSSRTTTKTAPRTQWDGCGVLYGYMSTHPSRRSWYGWL